MPRPRASRRARQGLAAAGVGGRRRDDLLGADHPVPLLRLADRAEQPAAPASSSQQPTEPQRQGSLPPVSGMCPNSPAEPCAPLTGRPPARSTPPMPVATCRCRATGIAAEHPAAGLGQAGQRRVVPGQHRPRVALVIAAEDLGHVHVLPVRQGWLHHLARAQRRGNGHPDADHAVAELAAADLQPDRDVGQHAGAGHGLPLLAVQHGAAPGQFEGGHGERVVPQVDRQRDGPVRVRRGHAGRAAPGARYLDPGRGVGRAAQLLDELASGQVPDQHGGGPPGQAELPGELGPGELPAAVVDRAQQPRQIVRAQLGTSGRRAFVLPHTPIVPRLLTLPARGPIRATSPSGSRRRSSRPGAGTGGRRTGCPARRSPVR